MRFTSFRARFIVLSIIVCISGFSQGMLLPLISFIFESRGISATLSGFHTAGLYLGVFISSFLIEAPMRKYGYQKLIIFGGLFVGVSLFLFPILDSIMFWFILRVIIGIADNVLHMSTQTWLTSTTPQHKIGKVIAVYGLFFSLGFMIGPKVADLVVYGTHVPFVLSSVITMLAWPLIFTLKGASEAKPDSDNVPITLLSTLTNFKTVIVYGWAALMFPMLYGFYESSLNSNFPVFAMRNGFEISQVTWILPMFNLGAILFQLPIGALGDRMGRGKLLTWLVAIGSIGFLLMELNKESFFMLTALFLMTGVACGSMYSLGLGYLTDVIPRTHIAAGNLLISIIFSIGSILGPVFGGSLISLSNGTLYFSFFTAVMVLVLIGNLIFRYQLKNRTNF